ncbi:MAG: 5,10-methylenetetrahydrofolate reductase [Desulfuromonas sp.]|nr:MAG: 5,10-methylenetetrahydrofolate reductase [Desulfuromonas sp.]
MSRLQQQLADGRFVITAEVAPPKGCNPDPALDTAAAFDQVTAVNVTDNQGANMRMTPLVLSGLLLQRGVEPILQLTCRDRNRMALQSDLLGAAALGIKNLLLLSGDHARFGDHPEARSVFDLDSVQLLQAVSALEQGHDLAGKKLSAAPRFFPGAAVSPASEPFELMMQKCVKKAAAGAQFFQTQAVFCAAHLGHFMATARSEFEAPVIAGILLLKSARMAHFLNDNIPGVMVPEELILRLESARQPLEEGVAIAREMVAAAREQCQGVHLMTLGREDLIPAILDT